MSNFEGMGREQALRERIAALEQERDALHVAGRKLVTQAMEAEQERDEALQARDMAWVEVQQQRYAKADWCLTAGKAEARAAALEGLLKECWSFLDTVEWDDNTADEACNLKETIDAALAEPKEGAK